jgi:hypothetical protein
VRAAIHITRWGVARAELRCSHAAAEVSDLQLTQLTRDAHVRVCMCARCRSLSIGRLLHALAR